MIKKGLRTLQLDLRDYKHSVVFGAISLPETFIIENLKIKNQDNSDLCTAFAVTTASEAQECIELSPEYQFQKIKYLMGDFDDWGADLRTAVKSLVKFGSLESSKNPFPLGVVSRDFIANWANWDVTLDYQALVHQKKTYFSILGYEDIKQAIYQHKTPVITGALWRTSWIYSGNGIVNSEYEQDGFGHAFVFIGWKKINNKEYLVAHLSNGESIGDKGRFYFSKDIVDKECSFGNFVIVDMPRDKADYYNSNGVSIRDNWLTLFLKQAKSLSISILNFLDNNK